jgi:hypothetical protein
MAETVYTVSVEKGATSGFVVRLSERGRQVGVETIFMDDRHSIANAAIKMIRNTK